jgi:hypothetical protein
MPVFQPKRTNGSRFDAWTAPCPVCSKKADEDCIHVLVRDTQEDTLKPRVPVASGGVPAPDVPKGIWERILDDEDVV